MVAPGRALLRGEIEIDEFWLGGTRRASEAAVSAARGDSSGSPSRSAGPVGDTSDIPDYPNKMGTGPDKTGTVHQFPGAAGFSAPKQRRLAYCVLKSRSLDKTTKCPTPPR